MSQVFNKMSKNVEKWWKVEIFYIFLHHVPGNPGMITFIGEYICKVDAKGRIMLPSAFKKQMPAGTEEKFVIKPDVYEACLLMYPIQEWERLNRIIRRNTNPFNREHERFVRLFNDGEAELALDANNRLLIPKRLLDHAKATKEILLKGRDGKIDVWSPENYVKFKEGISELESLTEKILGGDIRYLDEE